MFKAAEILQQQYCLVSARTHQENALFATSPLQLIVKTDSKIQYFLLTLWSHAVVRKENSSIKHYVLLEVPLFFKILKTPSKIRTVSIVHSYIFKNLLHSINILERILLAYSIQTFRTCLQKPCYGAAELYLKTMKCDGISLSQEISMFLSIL